MKHLALITLIIGTTLICIWFYQFDKKQRRANFFCAKVNASYDGYESIDGKNYAICWDGGKRIVVDME